MREVLADLHARIEAGLGGVLLANMIEDWLVGNPEGMTSVEAANELQDHRASPEQTGVHLRIRQSTNAQVLHHQESTERQYALREMALELGWSESAIRTLDRDLGMTGTEMTRREDFKTLVAEVSMGQVGAVFALEVSRLARSNLDWHRLLELCALTETLVIDEDGCYDPSDFNDGLLLGLKGTMAQAELHFLHARLQGGKLNKAKKGELRFPLPVGYCYDEQGRIVPDADARSAGRSRNGVSSVSRNGQRLCGRTSLHGKGLTISQASLRRGVGWQDYLGPAEPQPRVGRAEESILCGDLRLRPLPVSP